MQQGALREGRPVAIIRTAAEGDRLEVSWRLIIATLEYLTYGIQCIIWLVYDSYMEV